MVRIIYLKYRWKVQKIWTRLRDTAVLFNDYAVLMTNVTHCPDDLFGN